MAALKDFIIANWELLAPTATVLVVVIAYVKARSSWLSRCFLTRVNFSLNCVDGSVLKIRTLREDDICQILLGNSHGRRKVLKAARKTTVGEPFLHLSEDDAWVVLNAILNEISEQFSIGFLAMSAGVPVKSTTYVFGITCEKNSDVRTNKIRVMIIEKSLLEEIDEFTEFEFEFPSHSVRLETLKIMKEIHNDPKRGHLLKTVELVAVGQKSLMMGIQGLPIAD